MDKRQNQVIFRNPRSRDGKRIWEIAKTSGSLDLNSVYHYLILCRHFGSTGLVAELGGRMVGFVTAYIPPADFRTLFVWQVAVHASARGLGIGKGMLRRVFENAESMGVRYLSATITPANKASIALFTAAARELKAPFVFEEEFFSAADFGPSVHEPEFLFQIGPVPETSHSK